MATGIVSIATKLLGWPYVPVALLAINVVAYVGLMRSFRPAAK